MMEGRSLLTFTPEKYASFNDDRDSMTKICCVCASYNRPRLLGNAIAMFLAQDYQNKELVILEDSGVFGDQEIVGDSWRLISSTCRRPTIAYKRNEIISRVDANYIAVMDDDDWYFPWHLSAAVNALQTSQWAQPKEALEWDAPGLLGRYRVFSQSVIVPKSPYEAADCCYGGQWSYRRNAFLQSGGYPTSLHVGEDTTWCRKAFTMFGVSSNPINKQYPLPSYIYNRDSGSWHASVLGPKPHGLNSLAKMPRCSPDELKIELPYGYYTTPIPDLVKPRKW